MYLDDQSSVECTNCIFENNFAIEGSIIASYENSQFSLVDSTVMNNYAVSSVIAYIFNSVQQSLIENSIIASNLHVTNDELLDELTEE